MISVEEAAVRIAAAFAPLESERIPLAQAANRVLAENVTARFAQPPFAVSAMDGYAVRSADVAQVPATLRIIGESAAGNPYSGKIGKDETVRIFTGSAVPDGADAIVIQENAQRHGETVTLQQSAKPGQHIRPAGLDFKSGDILAAKGKRLSARDLALLAAGDCAQPRVIRKPVVAFAATGDELSRPGEPRRSGGIVASSGYGLGALIEKWGAAARDLGILADSFEELAALPDKAMGADLLITLGGASVGDRDLVQAALQAKGFVLDFWKIAMRPGKPLIFGRIGALPLLGLPGNPVSTLVCAVLFLRPAIAAMLGENYRAPVLAARLGRDLPANDSRQDYLRAQTRIRDGALWVDPFPVQDSSMLVPLAKADALILRAPSAPARRRGDVVEILPLDGI